MKKIQFPLVKIWLYSLVVLLLYSCQKDSTKTIRKLPTLLEFIELSKEDHSTVALTLDKGYAANQKVYPRLEATFINQANPRGVLKKVGDVEFEGYKLKSSSQNVYENIDDLMKSEDHRTFLLGLFGKTVTVKIDFDTTKNNNIALRNAEQISGQLYIPKEIDGNLQLLPQDGLSRNSTLSWTPDANNAKGVYIVIRFDAKSFGNEAFVANQSFHKAIQTEDNGSYNFSLNDFATIPIGALIDISWGRGNYIELNSGNPSHYVLLMSYSSKQKKVKIQ